MTPVLSGIALKFPLLSREVHVCVCLEDTSWQVCFCSPLRLSHCCSCSGCTPLRVLESPPRWHCRHGASCRNSHAIMAAKCALRVSFEEPWYDPVCFAVWIRTWSCVGSSSSCEFTMHPSPKFHIVLNLFLSCFTNRTNPVPLPSPWYEIKTIICPAHAHPRAATHFRASFSLATTADQWSLIGHTQPQSIGTPVLPLNCLIFSPPALLPALSP